MKFLKFWFPVICYSGIIFYVSSLPDVSVPYGQFYSDKLVHVAEYAILGYLLGRALATSTGLSRQGVLLITVLFCAFYGASDEFHQSFVPGRTCDVVDWLSDSLGGTIGSLLYVFKKKHRLGI